MSDLSGRVTITFIDDLPIYHAIVKHIITGGSEPEDEAAVAGAGGRSTPAASGRELHRCKCRLISHIDNRV